MISILGGLGAAVMWASSTLTSSRSTRIIGAASTLGWMMLVGLVVATPLALASGPLPPMTPTLFAWLAGSGLGGVVGLLLVYRGLRIGKVGVVSALASTEGAMAAVIAVIAGERLTLPVASMLGVIVVGIVAVALATEAPASGDSAAKSPTDAADGPAGLSPERRAVLYGSAAAICFGISIYSTAQAGLALPPFAAVMPVRVVGVVGVFVPMALAGRLRLSRRAAPMVVWIGIAEVLGNASYVVGARESIAVAAVLASQFAAIAAVAAFLLFRERLSLHQRSGVAAIIVGVALLTAFRG
jgi:drug/metabolite transporter (DMT)-like permease